MPFLTIAQRQDALQHDNPSLFVEQIILVSPALSIFHLIHAYIFDFDGVLISTEAWHYQTWKELSAQEGWLFDDTIAMQLQGKNRMESLETLLTYNNLDTKYTEKEKVDFCDQKQNNYLDLIQHVNEEDAVKGAKDLLTQLKENGMRLGLASSSRNARILLEKIGLSSFFEVIIDGNENFPSKPAPDIFLACAERLGVSPEQCLVIEDSASGVAAAQAAGMEWIQVFENELSTII